jgi:RNA polymerase sigma-70 factor, ECF subfamily
VASACSGVAGWDRLGRWVRAPVAEPLPGDSAEFVARLRAGDRRAFEDLVRVQQHRVYGLALRMLGNSAEAQDVAQEVFLRAHRGLAAFRGAARLSTWLYTIASRLCLSRLAGSERRFASHGEEPLDRLVDARPGPDEALERGELEEALHRAIAELPEERRLVVVLRDIEGLAYEEIAEILELPVGTVRSRLHRARLDLKEKLERFLP